MKKYLLVLLAAALVPIFAVVAQQPAAPQPEQVPVPDLDKPVAALRAPTASGTAQFCTVSYSFYVEDKDRNRVTGGEATVNANPWADVQEDHVRQVKVLRIITAAQNKGGPYTVTATEVLNCDNATENARPSEGSIFAEGITLAASTQITDYGLKMLGEINDRYKRRAVACKDQKACTGWDHAKAKKTCRNDRGQIVTDDNDPACLLPKNK